jgi:hypothetical protein
MTAEEGSMSLIEDYLHAIALLLPEAQREDIIAELRDVVLTRIEAREAASGRPLTESETEAVMREIGHPLVVAARYRGGPQHAVGPALYPYWAFAVKVMVSLQCALSAVVFLIRSLTGGDVGAALARALTSALTGAAMLVGLATIAALIIERYGLRIDYLDRWRVRDLEGLRFFAWDQRLWDLPAWRLRLASVGFSSPRRWGAGHETASSRAGRAVFAVVAGTMLTLWWLGALPFALVSNGAELRELGVDPGRLAAVDWQALKAAVFWPVLAYGLVIVAQGAFRLVRPLAYRLQASFDIAIGAALVAAAAWAWSAFPLEPLVRVGSVAELALRFKTAYSDGPPVDPTPFLTLVAVTAAVIGVVRLVRGVAALLVAAVDGGAHRVAQPE